MGQGTQEVAQCAERAESLNAKYEWAKNTNERSGNGAERGGPGSRDISHEEP